MMNRGPMKWLVPGKELSRSLPRVDFQMHTTWTDGRSSVRDMIEAAVCKRLSAIAITEHVNFESTYYASFVSETIRVRDECRASIEAYYGIEVAVCDYEGGLKTRMDVRREAEWVIGTVHSYPKEGGGYLSWKDLTRDEALQAELRALDGLASNRSIDVIGHPGGTYFLRYGGFPVELMEPMFRKAKANGVAVELNGRYLWDLEGMLDLLASVDPLVSLGSDAHHATEVGTAYEAVRCFLVQR
jgi:putative hydrolase